MTMPTSHPHSSNVTTPDMAHVRHVSKATEWLDGVVGGGRTQEDRQEGSWTGRCEGGQAGVKVGREVYRKARRSA